MPASSQARHFHLYKMHKKHPTILFRTCHVRLSSDTRYKFYEQKQYRHIASIDKIALVAAYRVNKKSVSMYKNQKDYVLGDIFF